MKRVLLLGAVTVPLLAQAVMPRGAVAQARDTQWREARVRRCPRADTLFGRFWRSHPSPVRYGYSPQTDTTFIRTVTRTASWQVSSSNLVGSESEIRVIGRNPQVDSAQIALTLRFVDSTYRSPEQAHVDLRIDDTVHVEILEPQVDYPMVAGVRGVPLTVKFLLTAAQSFALARAHEVRGTMGPYPFYLFDWELWDINSVYRTTVCGIE